MHSDKKMFIAFILNLFFSVFEFVGGAITGSVAILSDALHDLGDAAAIGVSWILEKISKRKPDKTHTYGYARYSVVGSLISTLILVFGSAAVIYSSIERIINPVEINKEGMIVFAVVGLIVNFLAVWFTRKGETLNQKAVNLHMLEDVLGWAVVLVGAIVIEFTNFYIIDPIMSLGVAIFILINALMHFKEAFDLFVEKTPHSIDLDELSHHILEIEGVEGVHHLHVWSIDGINNYATMHIVTDADGSEIKKQVKEELKEHGICHATLELEKTDEQCPDEHCHPPHGDHHSHHHHHH